MNNQKRTVIPISFHDSPTEPVYLFHIWLHSSGAAVEPGEAAPSVDQARANTLEPACSLEGAEKSIKMVQGELLVGTLCSESPVDSATVKPPRTWIELLDGVLEINGKKLASGESASVAEEEELRFESKKGAHFLLFDRC